MRHPTDGTLRRLLDEPAGVIDAEREHVAGCPACRSQLAAAQEDAAMVDAALEVPGTPDLDAAWRRLSDAIAAEGPRERPAAPARRPRPRRRGPFLAGLGVAAVLAGGGVAAAGDWLQIFRTQQVAPLTASQAELARLPDLSAYGDLDVIQEVELREVPDAAAAKRETGLAVPQVRELPRGVTGTPTYRVARQAHAEFTFSAEKAAEAAAKVGETLAPPPPGLDGTRFRLVAGPGLAAVWPEARGLPALLVARAIAPTADSAGLPFDTAREYLLSLPGIPDDIAAQLRSFSRDGTLPLFTATEEMETSTADVGGIPASVFTTRDGSMAGVVWVQDGKVSAVAGSLSADEVLSVARGLRWSP